MSKRISMRLLKPVVFLGVIVLGCGSSQPPKPEPQQEVEDYDLVGDIVGDVEVPDEEGGGPVEDYNGPTKLTVNLRIVNERNPEGAYKLITPEGKTLIESGKFGEPRELNQGSYTLEFASPLVFGGQTHVVEGVAVSGKEMTHNETFPAGQITLFTFYTKKPDKCVPVTFKVKDLTGGGRGTLGEKRGSSGAALELDGTANTCEPLMLKAGSYELELMVSKNKIQPVKLTVNSEQTSDARVEIEK